MPGIVRRTTSLTWVCGALTCLPETLGPTTRYLEADHAWGGGIDLTYFFHRYFGIGIEGWAMDARRAFADVAVSSSEYLLRRTFSAPVMDTRATRWVLC